MNVSSDIPFNVPLSVIAVGGVVALLLMGLLVLVTVGWIVPGLSWLTKRIFCFLGRIIRDVLKFVGIVLTGIVMMLLVLGNIVVGRFSAAAHFGRAMHAEAEAGAICLYRLFVGHWIQLFGLGDLTEGLENRVPRAIIAAPGPTMADGSPMFVNPPIRTPMTPNVPNPNKPFDRDAGQRGPRELETSDAPGEPLGPDGMPRSVYAGVRGSARFDGYTIIGSLPGGGSGSKLYVARPDAIKIAALEKAGFARVGDVVIKVFSVREGSSLPNIIRESRALEAAKKLGLVLEHQLSSDMFFYVMRYVPGDSLTIATQRLHASSAPEGLSGLQLQRAIDFASDLVATLDHYHSSGLWHKDIKPDNIIVSGADNRAHLVDFGLLTPLRSSMTLTTHGTEYFRDPEMVRMALRGVKVGEVDGAKFDIYGAGAVLYSILENSFPAHGALSQISKRCPDALRLIVRRAMTEYDKRYPTAAAMLADLRFVASSTDPFSVKPGQLPSMAEGESVAAATPVLAAAYAAPMAPEGQFARGPAVGGQQVPSPLSRGSAQEQLQRARGRAAQRRESARTRMLRRRSQAVGAPRASLWNAGVAAAVLVSLIFIGVMVLGIMVFSARTDNTIVINNADSAARETPIPEPTKAKVAAAAVFLNESTRPVVSTAAPTIASRTKRGDKSRAPVEPELTRQVDGVRAFIIREELALRETNTDVVQRQLSRLEESGFELIGAQHGVSGGAALDENGATQLEAAIRSAVGTAPLNSASAVNALRQWMKSKTKLTDADGEPIERPQVIVWFSRKSDTLDEMMVWVVTSEKAGTQVTTALTQALNVARRLMPAPPGVEPEMMREPVEPPSPPPEPESPGHPAMQEPPAHANTHIPFGVALMCLRPPFALGWSR